MRNFQQQPINSQNFYLNKNQIPNQFPQQYQSNSYLGQVYYFFNPTQTNLNLQLTPKKLHNKIKHEQSY